MKISGIMSMIDLDMIKSLGTLHKIDKINTKITGAFILKSFVYGAIQRIPMSLRSIETMTRNNKYIATSLKSKDPSKQTLDHSSIGKRLKTVNVKYFKEIYEDIANKYHKNFTSKHEFHIFDSTIITISNKLMKNGLNFGGAENDTHIKMSVSLKNSIPSSVRFCIDQSESSEDVALLAAINEAKVKKEDIVLFDRGIQKAETFADFDKTEKFFVTRINVGRKYKSTDY